MVVDIENAAFKNDRILVRAVEVEAAAEGLIRTSQYEDKPEFGEVLAVGDGRHLEGGGFVEMNVAVGDKILFGKYGAEKIRLKGNDYLVIRMEDVIAIV